MKALALLLALPLAACGLKPLYSNGASGTSAAALAEIEVAPIPGRGGWLLANALHDRIAAAGQTTPRYRLQAKMDDDIVGLGVRRDDSVTRERRTIRVRYQLVALDKGTVVLDATAGSDAGIDVVGSEYATIAAEQTAEERLAQVLADKIVTRIAVFAQRPPAR